MARKRYSNKPRMPKDSESLEAWKKYKEDIQRWKREQEEKKKLIMEIRNSKR
jgi:hypothetical protein